MHTTVTTPLGLELTVHVWGPAAAPPLVLLHGFMDSAEAFAQTMAPLSDRWRVIAPDQRGHGCSDHIGPGGYYHFTDYVMDLDAIIGALVLDDEPRPVVVGHSMGASVALYYAGAFPERVRGLVLVDGIGPESTPVSAAPALMRRWIDAVNQRAPGRHAAPPQDAARVRKRLEASAPGLSPSHLERVLRARARATDSGQLVYRFDRLHRTPSPWHLDAARFAAFCSAVTAPTLAVWGSRTPFRHGEVATRQGLIANLREVTIDDCGHNIHLERPDALGAAIAEFVDQLSDR